MLSIWKSDLAECMQEDQMQTRTSTTLLILRIPEKAQRLKEQIPFSQIFVKIIQLIFSQQNVESFFIQ